LAQRAADELLKMEGVSAVIGTNERGRIVEAAERLLSGDETVNLTHNLKGCGYEPMQVAGSGDRTRGVLKIQEGCDCFCSYCIIPYVRGRSRSRGFDDILSEADAMAQSGVKEIVLTGIHLASYCDGERQLGDLIQALDGCDVRMRLGSIEPGVLGEDFIEKAATGKNLCPHFHLSLQSGSASVLKRMNRPYTPEEYMSFVSLLRRYFQEPAITTDIIAGFPAETDSEHNETMEFVEKIAFSRIHVFPFSPREGTRAFSMTPRIPKAVAKQRASELIKLGDMLENRYISNMIGRDVQVLFEEPSEVFEGCLEGYSDRYIRVAAKANRNELKTVKLTEQRRKTVLGR
jgi:threonylcarbamoyladenosine tRNA methylthiotransferase MtaB